MKMAKRLLRCNTQMHVLHVINHPSKTKSSKPGLRETSTLFLFTHSTMWWSSRLSPQKFRFCRFQILGTHLRCFSWWKFNDHFKKIISNLEFPQKKETPLLNHFAPSFGLSVAIDKPACTIRTGVWLMNRSLLNPFFGGRMSLDVTTIHQDRLTRDPVHLSEPWILEHIFGDTCSSQVSHVFVFNKQGYRDSRKNMKKHEKTIWISDDSIFFRNDDDALAVVCNEVYAGASCQRSSSGRSHALSISVDPWSMTLSKTPYWFAPSWKLPNVLPDSVYRNHAICMHSTKNVTCNFTHVLDSWQASTWFEE